VPPALPRVLRRALFLLLIGGCTRPRPGRYAIDRIDIEGATVIDASEIEDRIATSSSPRFLGLFRGIVLDYELFDRYVLERDLARIERFYRARGYYDAHVRAGRVEKTGDAHVRVQIVVDEGPVVNVGEVRVEGLSGLPLDDAAEAFAAVRRLRHGRPFDEDRLDAARTRLASALGDRGYAHATVDATAEVDLIRHEADVTFVVEPKTRARFGAVTLSGLGSVPEEPVRRAVDLVPGDWYSESKLESARRAVLALGVFSDADVSAVRTDDASAVVPIAVRLVPTNLRAIKLGGGIELDQIRADAHLMIGWEDRNFLGGLRRLTIDTRPGIVLEGTQLPSLKPPKSALFEDRSRLELRQPGFLEARTGGTVRGEFNMYPVLLPADSTSNTADFDNVLGYRDLSSGIGVDRSFGPIYATLFYNFQTSFPFGYHADLPSGFKRIMLSYVDLTANLDFRDNSVHPHAGIFLGNDLQIAKNPFIKASDTTTLLTNDWRVQSEVRGYLPLSRRVTLAVRAMVGFLFPSTYAKNEDNFDTGDIQQVYFRGFFSGGPNSNRGYTYRGVGPKHQAPFLFSAISCPAGDTDSGACQNAVTTCARQGPASLDCQGAMDTYCKTAAGAGALVCNFPTGGLSVWEASAELRFPIVRSLEGAIFCDASDVSRKSLDLRWLYPHLSCGVGVHYDTPVGPLRLDVGYQIPRLQYGPDADLTRELTSGPFAISIGIGEAF
jgi:outer membrane protein assembly factor BamA